MIYIAVLLILIMCIVIIALLYSFKKTRKINSDKIALLHTIIQDLKENLENKNLKVLLSDATLLKIRESNKVLSQEIVGLNTELFETLYQRK